MPSLDSQVRENSSITTVPPPSILWHPGERELQRRSDTQIIEDPTILAGEIEERVLQWYEKSAASNFYVGVDGISGAGKTTQMESIRNVCARRGIQIHETSIDSFITTASKDRPKILQSPDIFATRHIAQDEVRKLMASIHQANGHGATIDFAEMYHRSEGHGRIGPGQIHVPPGRKVVILEGVNAARFTGELEEKHGAEVLNIHVDARPETAMQRAVRRDAASGRWTAEGAYKQHKKEFDYLKRPMENSRNRAHVIYAQN